MSANYIELSLLIAFAVLATGRQSEDVPYKDMTKSARDRKRFVADQYLPRKFVMRDPHNLKVEEAQNLIKFLMDRQASHAPAQVFRFHAFKLSRKGAETHPTIYPDEIDPENPPVIKEKVKRQPRTKDKNPSPTSPDTEGNAGADRTHIGAAWDNANLLQMTPTPEPPDVPGITQAQVDAAGNGKGNNTIPMAPWQPQAAAQSYGTHGSHLGACDDPSLFLTTTNNFPPANAVNRSMYSNTTTHHITPGPHQMLVGDWTPHFCADYNTGVNIYDGHYDFVDRNNLLQEFGLAPDIGYTSYDAGRDAIDYGVPLNMPTTQMDDTNGDLAGFNAPNTGSAPTNYIQSTAGGIPQNDQTGYRTPADYDSSAWHQPQLIQHDMAVQQQIPGLTGSNHGPLTPVNDSAEQASQVQRNANAVGTANQKGRGKGSSKIGVSAEDSGKGKRTADVLAAEEAQVMGVPAKRQRRRRVRES